MRLLRWMIEHVAVVYPAGYREAHGDEIVDGLTEAAIENTRFGLARHIASVAVHGWITRARYATGGRRGEAVRQGLLLALVVTLGLATADASGWRGWPYVFATGLLLAGMWVLLCPRRGGR